MPRQGVLSRGLVLLSGVALLRRGAVGWDYVGINGIRKELNMKYRDDMG